mgnify:CR=1 FL=1
MKKQSKEPIRKIASERTRKTFPRKMTLLAILMMVCIASLALALFLPETLILTVPFLVAPSVFAFMAVNTVLDMPIPNDEIGFFMMFKLYFSRFFFGCFKMLKAFLIALLWVFVITFVASMVFFLLNQDLLNAMSALIESVPQEEMATELIKLMESNNNYNLFMILSNAASLFVGFFVFTHHAMIEGFKYYFNFLAKAPILAQDLNTISRPTFKKIRKPFYKDYYKCVWFIPILMLVGYVGGVALAFFFLDVDVIQLSVIGLFGSLLTTMFAIPYYFDCTLQIFKKYHNEYINNFVKLSMDTLKEMKKNEEISKEKEKEIIDFLEEQKQKNEDNKKK